MSINHSMKEKIEVHEFYQQPEIENIYLSSQPSTFEVNPESGESLSSDQLQRPIIGIFTQRAATKPSCSYIPSSYVKWIESGGGRVLPILYDLSEEQMEVVFEQLDGVLLPGGSESLERDTKFMESNTKVLEFLKSENEKGFPFPMFATCQGFQVLAIIAPDVYLENNSNEKISTPNYGPKDVLFECKGTKRSCLPLKLIEVEKSEMFSSDPILGPSFARICKNHNVTLNSHRWGVDYSTFRKTGMEKHFRVVSTNTDQAGKEFISTFEHRSHPIYSVQYHPEKISFEDQPTQIAQEMYSNMFNLYLSSFFVEKARKYMNVKNMKKKKNLKDERLMIERFRDVEESKFCGYFRSVYYFKEL